MSERTDSSARSGLGRLIYAGVLYTVTFLCLLTAFMPLLKVDLWWVRIGDFPRLQLLAIYIAVALGLLPLWRRTAARGLGLFLAGAIVLQVVWIADYLPFTPVTVQRAERPASVGNIRLMGANVHRVNRQSKPLLEQVFHVQPDVLVLCEIDDWWREQLQPLADHFAHSVIQPQENGYGMAFYSNLPVTDASVRHWVRPEVPSIDATVTLRNGKACRIIAVHPNPPRIGKGTDKRDAELIRVGNVLRECDCTAIVMGDMNDVGWSSTTDLFKEVSGLLDPRVGRGMYATYDATSKIWRYPLDYIFHSDDFRLVDMRVLPDIESDHFPLYAELSYEPAAEPHQDAPELDAGDREDAREALQVDSESAAETTGTGGEEDASQ